MQQSLPLSDQIFWFLFAPPLMALALRVMLGGWLAFDGWRPRIQLDRRKNFLAFGFLGFAYLIFVVIFGAFDLQRAGVVHVSQDTLSNTLQKGLVAVCAVVAIGLPILSRMKRRR